MMMRLIIAALSFMLLSACGVQGSLTLPEETRAAMAAKGKKPSSSSERPLRRKSSNPQRTTEQSVLADDPFLSEDGDGSYDIRGNF